jgi:hypothetical protein
MNRWLIFFLAALTSCTPGRDYKEERSVEAMRGTIARVFGFEIPSLGPDMAMRAARQSISPYEFAVVKLKTDSVASLESLESAVAKLVGERANADEAYFDLNPDNLSWWDTSSVKSARRYRISGDNGKGIHIVFPVPETGEVYVTIGGVDWER